MTAGDPVAGLVLAAGQARRFGGAKLAAALEGRPLLAHILDTVRSAVEEETLSAAVAVLPAGRGAFEEAGFLRRLARERGVRVIANDDPAAGLARSLRLGLAALEGMSVGAGLVLLGDQPFTRLAVIRALVAEWRRRGAPVLVPLYHGGDPGAGSPGNPVILAREVWGLARRLRGDTGMSAVVRRRPDLVAYLPVAGSNPDVDVPADLEALTASLARL